MRSLFFLFCLLSFFSTAQNAEFSVGLLEFNYDDSASLAEMEWIIDGQILKLGSKPVRLRSLNPVDTIFFRGDAESETQTFLCKIDNHKKYLFSYNTCCGGFDAYSLGSDEKTDRNYGSVNFTLLNAYSEKEYILFVAENSHVFNGSGSIVLEPEQSPMVPNLYTVSLFDNSIPRLTEEWEWELGGNGNFYEYPELYLVEFYYMPLSDDPLYIVFDVQTGKLEFK